jgi:hypothetical protein
MKEYRQRGDIAPFIFNLSTIWRRKIPGSKADRCVRLTTYYLLVPNVKKIRGLNLPYLPWACSGL